MTRGSRILGLFFRLFFVGIGSLLLLALCFEIFLRATGFLAAQPANYPCITGDSVINHVFQANCKGVATAEALKTSNDVTYQTNKMGTRGHDPIAGLKKIVVLGDSYTEGFGLEESDSFPAVLESAIRGLGAQDWQVLNGGTLGFSTVLYPKYFDRFFLFSKPELVVLNLDLTDFNDDSYFLQIAEFDSLGNPIAFPGREAFPQWTLGYVYSNRSALLRFVHQEYNQWKLAQRRDDVQWQMDKWIENDKALLLPGELKNAGLEGCAKSITAVAKSVLELKKHVELSGGKFAIHMYPPGSVVKSYAGLPQNLSFVRGWDQKNKTDFSWSCGVNPKVVDLFRAISARQEIPFFDSFPFVLGQPDKEKLYFDRDAHWNKDGVRVVANDLAVKLMPLLRGSGKKK